MKWMMFSGALGLLLLTSCRTERGGELRENFRWLVGHWQAETNGHVIHETWRWAKFRYEGSSVEINERGDTVFTERIYIESFDDKIGYVVNLPDGSLVLFRGEPMENGWRFVNPEHVFPSIIEYHNGSEGRAEVWLRSSKTSDVEITHNYALEKMKSSAKD